MMGVFRGRPDRSFPGCPLGGTPWPLKGVYRHSCSPPPRRGDIRPTLGTEKSLYVSWGQLPHPDIHTEAPCFPCLDRAPGAPISLSSSQPVPGQFGPSHSLFTEPGLQVEAVRNLIGSFSIPGCILGIRLVQMGGALGRHLQWFPFKSCWDSALQSDCPCGANLNQSLTAGLPSLRRLRAALIIWAPLGVHH